MKIVSPSWGKKRESEGSLARIGGYGGPSRRSWWMTEGIGERWDWVRSRRKRLREREESISGKGR